MKLNWQKDLFFLLIYITFAYKVIRKDKKMETMTVRKSASFRLNADLLETLKRHAKAANCSLNNYVESVLLDAMYFEPNEETKAAIEEARSGKPAAGTLDLDNFDAFVKSIDEANEED